MPATDLVPLVLQFPGQLSGSVEWPLQMQLVQNPHQLQIPLRQAPRDVVNARAAQIQQLCLALHRYLAIPLNHRLPLRPGNFPSAPDKKEFSIVSSPIFARSPWICAALSSSPDDLSKMLARLPKACVFQVVT